MTPLRAANAAGPLEGVPRFVPTKGSFIRHPVYATADYLVGEVGLPGLHPTGVNSLNRNLTRYEFAVDVQRMYQGLRRSHKVIEDSDRCRTACIWLSALMREFQPELAVIGVDVPTGVAALAEWGRFAAGAVKSAAAKLEDRSAPPITGPFSDVFLPRDGQVNRTPHPAYAVANFLSQSIWMGYPDGAFRGKRGLTRYEFAVALQRALTLVTRLRQMAENPGDVEGGWANEIDRIGRLSTKPALEEALLWVETLWAEFHDELAMLGADNEQIARTLAVVRQSAGPIAGRLAAESHKGAVVQPLRKNRRL